MNLLADVDLGPIALLVSGVTALAGTVVILWKVSRGDADARLAAMNSALEEARAREIQHITERGTWVELQLRTSKALEEIADRFDRLERRKEIVP